MGVIQAIIEELRLTATELQQYGGYISDFRSGRLDAEHFRGAIRLAREVHRTQPRQRRLNPVRPSVLRASALAELGLSDGATQEQIRANYRKLIVEHHPDAGGSNERAAAINAAFTLLTR